MPRIITLFLAIILCSTAAAAESTQYNIPTGPLSKTLAAFAQQSDIQISYDPALASGKQSKGVRGSHTPVTALQKLLVGSNVTYRFTSSDSVTLSQASGNNADTLSPILVEGAQDAVHQSADNASAIDVSRIDLERRNATTVKDVFAGESGVSVGGAVPLVQKVYVNGVEETNLAVTIDGARQNNKVFHHIGNNIIDPSLLKRARVDPSVAPADAGPGALAGSIAYETVDATDLLTPDQPLGGFTTASFDSNGDTFTTGASGYAQSDAVDALGFIKRGSGDDYADGDGSRVRGTESDFLTFLLKTGFKAPGGHRFEVSAERINDDANRPFRANIGALPARPGPIVRQYDIVRSNYVLSYGMPLADGLWDPTILIGYGQTELGVPEPFGSVGETTSLSGKIENTFNFDLVNSITAGVDFYEDKASYEDPATPSLEETAVNFGGYAQARLNPLSPLLVSFGSRVDHQRFEGVDGTDMDNTGVSGNISLDFMVTDHISLKAGYSNVWGGIRLAENFILNPGWVYDDIDPIRAENYTVGAAFNKAGFTFDAEIFQSDFEDARDESFGGGPSITTDFETEGYNLGTGYQWRTGFTRISYTDSEITIDGDPTNSDATQYFGTPLGRIFAVEIAQVIESLGLRLGGTIDAALKNNDTVAAGGQPLDAYEVFNLYAEYRPMATSALTLRLETNNVLDEQYADRATYGQDFATVQPLAEQGRSFLVQARLQF